MDGVGARLVKELKDLPESDRPVHFSQRRIKEYFTKAMEGWVKEGKDKTGLKQLVEGTTNKHLQKLIEMKNEKGGIIDDDYEAYQNTMFNLYKGLYDDAGGQALKQNNKKMECLILEKNNV